MQYKIEEGEWQTYTNEVVHSEDTTGTTYFFKVISAAGVESDVVITANDDTSEIATIQYLCSDSVLTETEEKELTTWSDYTATITETVADAKKVIYYVKLTDQAGNSTTVSVTMKTIADISTPIDMLTEDRNPEILDAIEDVNVSNVTEDDKQNLEDAKKLLLEVLENNSPNYTEEEKLAIEKQIEAIDEALIVLENVKDIQSMIDALPNAEDVKLSDKDAITEAKNAYDALSDYEKSLVDRTKLDKVSLAINNLFP